MTRYVAYEPGDEIPVEVTDAGTSEPGDLVEVTGEGSNFTQVQQATDDAAALGMLITDPSDDTTDDTVRVSKPVYYLSPEGSYAPTAGDLVAERAGGTVSDTDSGAAAIDKTNAYGQVITTNVRSLHVGDRVAVAAWR